MSDPRVFAAPNPSAERHASPPASAAIGNRALWFAVFAPPVAWSLDSLTAIALHHDYCAALLGREFKAWSGITVLLVGVGVLMLICSLTGGLAAWRAFGLLGKDDGLGDTDIDRRRFMARAALLGCALFSYGIILRTITVAFLGPRHCGS